MVRPSYRRDATGIRAAAFADAYHGWAVTFELFPAIGRPRSTILVTTDGGATWTVQSSYLSVGLDAVDCDADATHCWATGFDFPSGKGVVLTTGDAGAHWEQQGLDVSNHWLTDVSFADTSNGWAVGPAATSWRPTMAALLEPASVGRQAPTWPG